MAKPSGEFQPFMTLDGCDPKLGLRLLPARLLDAIVNGTERAATGWLRQDLDLDQNCGR